MNSLGTRCVGSSSDSCRAWRDSFAPCVSKQLRRDLPMPYAFRCAAALLGMLGALLCLISSFIQPYQFQVGSGARPRSAPTPVQARTGADLEKPTPSKSTTASTDRLRWNQSSKPARVRNKTDPHRLDHQALYRRLSEVASRDARRAMDNVDPPRSSFVTKELNLKTNNMIV